MRRVFTFRQPSEPFAIKVRYLSMFSLFLQSLNFTITGYHFFYTSNINSTEVISHLDDQYICIYISIYFFPFSLMYPFSLPVVSS